MAWGGGKTCGGGGGSTIIGGGGGGMGTPKTLYTNNGKLTTR